MARKAHKSALGINIAAKFAEGFMQGTKERQELERMAAERMLKQEQDARDADLKQKEFKLKVLEAGKGTKNIYYDKDGNERSVVSPGLSTEQQNQLLGARRGKQVPEGTFAPPLAGAAPEEFRGKTTVQRAPKAPKQKVAKSQFLANPGAYDGKDIDIVDDTKRAPATPQQQASLYILKTAYKQYADTGAIPAHMAQNVAEASKNLDVNLIPEEEQGMFYALMQKLPGASKSYTLNANPNPAPALPGAPKPAAKMIRVKHKASGQTGSIPENEFDSNIYEAI